MIQKTGSLGKGLVGEQIGGEGQDALLKTSSELEFSGVHGGEMKSIHAQSGHTESHGGTEEAGFSLHSSAYAGPENMVPTNLGVRNPDEISNSKHNIPYGK